MAIASARRPIEKADLNQVRLVDVLDGVRLLGNRRRQAVDDDRAAVEFVDDRPEQATIAHVEAEGVHVEQGCSAAVGDLHRDTLGPPASAKSRTAQAEQAVRDARRAARAPRQFLRGLKVEADAKNARRPYDDLFDVGWRVEIQAMHDPEPSTERRRQQPRARRRADERERLERHLDRARRRPAADHDVELEVLHRRIEDLLDVRREAVNLVDEDHFALVERGEHPREIARALDDRARRRSNRRAQLVGDDCCERRLAETRRTIQQDVIERLAPVAGGGNRHLQVLADAVLADVVVERPRAQPDLVLRVFVDARRRDDARVRHSRQ